VGLAKLLNHSTKGEDMATSTLFGTESQQDALFALDSQISMEFRSLVDELRPRKIEDFIGLARPKAILGALLKRPRSVACLLVGPPGVGKTAISQAFSEQLGATTWEIPAQECTADRLRDLCFHLSFVPKSGLNGFHCVLVSEAETMSDAASKLLLSKLDSTGQLKNVIWLFSCNSTSGIEERFISRCLRIDFNSYGSGSEIADYLAKIWKQKMGDTPAPSSLKKVANGNVRDSLMQLECLILEAQA
jgi:replication-associated recombination protein RarA